MWLFDQATVNESSRYRKMAEKKLLSIVKFTSVLEKAGKGDVEAQYLVGLAYAGNYGRDRGEMYPIMPQIRDMPKHSS